MVDRTPTSAAKRPAASAHRAADPGVPGGIGEDQYLQEALWFEQADLTSQGLPPDLATLRTDVMQLATHTRPFAVSSAKAIQNIGEQHRTTYKHLHQLHEDVKAFQSGFANNQFTEPRRSGES